MAALIGNTISISKTMQAKPSNNQFFTWKRNNNMTCNQSKSSFIKAVIDPGSLVTASKGDKYSTKPSLEPNEGIGIVNYLHGKNLLITGSTGFVGKVLVEKILRTIPHVGKIFLLINAKNREAAVDRLEKEIMGKELFRCLKQTHGKSFQAFMLSKVVPVSGDLRKSNLGIQTDIADELASEVDVIINSAANTTFDERYDVAIDVNTLGPCRILNFAERCKRIEMYVHISTAYVSGTRQGKIMEKLWSIEDRDKSAPLLDVEAEIKIALVSREAFGDHKVTPKMKQLGLERAEIHGWRNTYELSKVMGEMQIEKVRGKIPVVIVRPSIIESSYGDPFPGWIEGNRMLDPLISLYGRGLINCFLVDPKQVVDIVPVDLVVNGTLAAMAKHATTGKPQLNIYHITSSVVNPLANRALFDLVYEHFKANPYMDPEGKPIKVSRLKLFTSKDEFLSHISTEASTPNEKVTPRLRTVRRKLVEKLDYIATLYQQYAFYGGRFDSFNSQRLMEEMSEEEKRVFGFDLGNIDWMDYIIDIHIPGVRRYLMKQK